MNLYFNIKQHKDNFVVLASYQYGKQDYPIKQVFSNAQHLTELLSKCKQIPTMLQLFTDETLFEEFSLSYSEFFALLQQWQSLGQIGVYLRIPHSVSRSSKLKVIFKSPKKKKMITSVNIDDITLSPEEIKQIKQGLRNFIFLAGKWRPIDAKLIDALTDNDLDILRIIQLLSGENEIFLPDDITLINDPILITETGYRATIKATLRKYQVKAVELLLSAYNRQQSILLADDMGLGKTLTIITFLNILYNTRTTPNLIIVPKTLVHNWAKEIQKFSPDVQFEIVKDEITPGLPVYITTYGHALHNPKMYAERHWNSIILDEAQQIKNAHTKISQLLSSLSASFKVAMTGTPIENSVMDLWSIFRFLDKEVLGEEDIFCKTVTNDHEYKWLNVLLEPYIIRRVKTDKSLGLNLPDKREQVIYCELTDQQKVAYNEVVQQFANSIRRTKNHPAKMSAFKTIHLLKMICSDYAAIVDDYSGNPGNVTGKYRTLLQLLENHDGKAIIFTQYRTVAKKLHKSLSVFYGEDGLLIDGTISAKKRSKIADDFQSGMFPFIIITLKAGNAGLTLTQANLVVHYDRWWNPSVESQATDRAHRIGQTQVVDVIKLVSLGTLEERIDEILSDKIDLFNKIFTPLNMTNEEFLNLIKFQPQGADKC